METRFAFGGIYGSDFPDVVAELERNHRQLALCPLTRDIAIDLKTLPTHGYGHCAEDALRWRGLNAKHRHGVS
jgi:hypothetical protein